MTIPFYSFAIDPGENADAASFARQRARAVADLTGLTQLQQTKLATVVFEIAQQAVQRQRRVEISFSVDDSQTASTLQVTIRIEESGLQPADNASGSLFDFDGFTRAWAANLFDHFDMQTVPGDGTTLQLDLTLSAPGTPISLANLSNQLENFSALPPASALAAQNLELLNVLEEFHRLQRQNNELNEEIESTNRGVVALYAELDDKAEQLRRADELKTHFFSNMSHEFRTPVNSILALSQILLDRIDGELTGEQTKQVSFIRKAAQDLGDLVTDLLDLIKMEAGRATFRPSVFEINSLFGALRGMLRPLATNPAVNLIFEEPPDIPQLHTDEAHVAQILRNFISNALKFTERGEVRVSARLGPGASEVSFSVADTGIGIAPQDQERIFQEFAQVENPIQKRVKGTGLGLSLSKRLAELLGGAVALESDLGRGSTFSLRIPIRHPGLPPLPSNAVSEDTRLKLLLIDDDEIARYVLKGYLADTKAELLEAADGAAGMQLAIDSQPSAIFLDLIMPGLSGFEVLNQLNAHPITRDIPVIVITSQVLEEEDRQQLLSQAVAVLSKETPSREAALAQLHEALQRARALKPAVLTPV